MPCVRRAVKAHVFSESVSTDRPLFAYGYAICNERSVFASAAATWRSLCVSLVVGLLVGVLVAMVGYLGG